MIKPVITLMEFKRQMITHSDIHPKIKKEWRKTGKTPYWLNKGWKTSVSPLLIVTGFTGLIEAITHHPLILMWFGVDSIFISIILIVLGVLNIWICDRIYEYYKLRKLQENNIKEKITLNRINEQDETIKELTHEVAEVNADLLIEKETTKILKEKYDDLIQYNTELNKKIDKEKALENAIKRFIEDLNQ